jgi:TonB-dependent receptor
MGIRSLRAIESRGSLPNAIARVYAGHFMLAVGATLLTTTPSFAQTGEVDEVVVTGIRQSIESAQEIKRNAEQIVDSVSAVDITALPDRSVTETLQRIPGIAIDHLFAPNDTNRFSAEGSGVVIRGLTQVRSELNGRDVFSARNTRGLSFEDVPSELMAGVDVYKNPSADMIEGGIAGSVNLRTRKPFDSSGFVFGATASVNYGDFAEDAKPQGSVMLSNTWDTGIGEMGLLVNVAYSELATRTDSIQFGRPFRRDVTELLGSVSNAVDDCPSMAGGSFSCVYLPAGARWSELDFDRERVGGAIAFQWRPSDRTEVSLQALQSDYTMNWTEHSAWFQAGAYDTAIAPNTTANFDANGNFVSGRLVTTNGDVSWVDDELLEDTVRILQPGGAHIPTGATTRFAEMHQRTTDIGLNFRFDATDKLSLTFDAQYVKATADNFDYTVNTAVWPDALDIDLSGSLPQISIVGADHMLDPANYYWAAGMDNTQDNVGDERAARLDANYEIDSGWIRSLRAGVRVTDRNATNKDTGYNWQPITEWWMGNSAGGWPGQVAPLDNYLTSHSRVFSFDNFYRGDTNLPGGLWVASDALVRNLNSNGDLLAQAQINGPGSGWSPDEFEDADANRQSEDTYAGYFLLRFAGDMGSLPLDGNIGVRYVRTETAATGFAQQPDWMSYGLLAPEIRALGGGQSVAVTQEGEYSDVLPSLNVRLKLTDDLQWRFAFSKALARPTFDQLRANVSLGGDVEIVNDISTDPPTPISQRVTAFTGDGGNPWLKPMRSTQFDTSLEWYFAQQGSLTGTLFYKDVKDYFITATESQSIFGQDWQVETTINGDKGIIQGVELAYAQFFDFLPGILKGLGFQGNYTYVDSKGSPGPTAGTTTVPNLPLEGLSRKSYKWPASSSGCVRKGCTPRRCRSACSTRAPRAGVRSARRATRFPASCTQKATPKRAAFAPRSRSRTSRCGPTHTPSASGRAPTALASRPSRSAALEVSSGSRRRSSSWRAAP